MKKEKNTDGLKEKKTANKKKKTDRQIKNIQLREIIEG